MKQANRECSRYDGCSVNNCPLHSSYPELSMDSEDRNKVCSMEKNVRTRIGANHPELKYGGLKQREYSAKLAYDHLTPEQKEQKRIQARNMSLSRLVVNEPCV